MKSKRSRATPDGLAVNDVQLVDFNVQRHRFTSFVQFRALGFDPIFRHQHFGFYCRATTKLV
ncbi:hypothetical protein OUZ56_019863 [Daphnia magna]|uniref:Uncharacterized protein n=1 Tax=Daphnia magna TaxID=35525 RepID=A0ABQ9ZCU9_9CRUS|nr:hypothetical protein OUZ56_019863 [Daphnia magna]